MTNASIIRADEVKKNYNTGKVIGPTSLECCGQVGYTGGSATASLNSVGHARKKGDAIFGIFADRPTQDWRLVSQGVPKP